MQLQRQLPMEDDANGNSKVVKCEVSYVQLEDMRKKCKTHRNIMELDKKYLEFVLEASTDSIPKMKKRNQISFASEI